MSTPKWSQREGPHFLARTRPNPPSGLPRGIKKRITKNKKDAGGKIKKHDIEFCGPEAHTSPSPLGRRPAPKAPAGGAEGAGGGFILKRGSGRLHFRPKNDPFFGFGRRFSGMSRCRLGWVLVAFCGLCWVPLVVEFQLLPVPFALKNNGFWIFLAASDAPMSLRP